MADPRAQLEADVHAAIAAALRAVEPARLVHDALRDGMPAAFAALAVGKAAHGMIDGALAAGAERGATMARALVVAPAAAPERAGVTQYVAAHPHIDETSATAGAAVLAWLADLPSGLPLLALLSGGASALMVQPLHGLTLRHVADTHLTLHTSGLRIDDVNTVRKHIDGVKGGRLAALSGARRVDVLVISDVIGNRLDVIGSGPFHPDPGTWADALVIMERLEEQEYVPRRVMKLLEAGARGEYDDTPKPGDACFAQVRHRILADNSTARRAAGAALAGLGYDVIEESTPLRGEAEDYGRQLGHAVRGEDDNDFWRARRAGSNGGRTRDRPATAWVAGGELVVTVRGRIRGRGGRGQELALAAALELEDARGVILAAFATDGVDGPTDAAGAIVDGSTARRIRDAGIDPVAALAEKDSHRALAAANALIRTGPTGTNVNDIVVVLRTGR